MAQGQPTSPFPFEYYESLHPSERGVGLTLLTMEESEISGQPAPMFKKRNVTGQAARKRQRIHAEEDNDAHKPDSIAPIPSEQQEGLEDVEFKAERRPTSSEPATAVRRPEVRSKRGGVHMTEPRRALESITKKTTRPHLLTNVKSTDPYSADGTESYDGGGGSVLSRRFVAPVDTSTMSWRDDPHT